MVTFSDRIARVLMVLAAVWAFALCFLIVADALSRSFLNSPIQGTAEVVANSIVMIVFLQAGYAIRSHSMLRAQFLAGLFGPGVRRVIHAFGYFFGAGFFLVLVTGAIDPAIHSWVSGEYEGEGALRVPAWPTRFIIVMGAGLAVLNYLVLAGLALFAPDLEAER